jgi:hypothetical protein
VGESSHISDHRKRLYSSSFVPWLLPVRRSFPMTRSRFLPSFYSLAIQHHRSSRSNEVQLDREHKLPDGLVASWRILYSNRLEPADTNSSTSFVICQITRASEMRLQAIPVGSRISDHSYQSQSGSMLSHMQSMIPGGSRADQA